jgi:uncharacterized protein YciW
MTTRTTTRRDSRAELQAWYLASLQPKLRHAASTGAVLPGAAMELDQQLRALLDLSGEPRREAA